MCEQMGPRELFALSLRLPEMTQLHTLVISGNAVDDACARTLVAGLRTANCIRNLDVSRNHITAKGAKEFAAHLFRVRGGDALRDAAGVGLVSGGPAGRGSGLCRGRL